HRPLHVIGQHDVLDLDRGHLRAPGLGVPVDDILDLFVDARGIGEKLIQAEAPDDVAHRRLADLIDSIVDVLDHDHGALRIGNMIVGHRGDIDRDVVLGDDLLRRDQHGDGAQRDARHLLDRNKDEREPRSAHALKFSKQEHDAALVLSQHANRDGQIGDDRDEKTEDNRHARIIADDERTVEALVPIAGGTRRDALAAASARPHSSSCSANSGASFSIPFMAIMSSVPIFAGRQLALLESTTAPVWIEGANTMNERKPVTEPPLLMTLVPSRRLRISHPSPTLVFGASEAWRGSNITGNSEASGTCILPRWKSR